MNKQINNQKGEPINKVDRPQGKLIEKGAQIPNSKNPPPPKPKK